MFPAYNEVQWADVKLFAIDKKVNLQYISFKQSYWITAMDGDFKVWCRIGIAQGEDTPSTEQTEFETNYKVEANNKLQDTDTEGRNTIRLAYAKKGWVYLAHPIEFETCKLNGCYSKDWLGQDRTDFTMKFYKLDAGVEVEMVQGADDDATFQGKLDTECVRTDILFKKGGDYELIGGNIHQETTPTEDVRLWVVGGIIDMIDIDDATALLTNKEMVGGINFKHLSNQSIETDGRASKLMKKDNPSVPGFDANGLRYIVRTKNAGYKHKLSAIMEYFRL